MKLKIETSHLAREPLFWSVNSLVVSTIEVPDRFMDSVLDASLGKVHILYNSLSNGNTEVNYIEDVSLANLLKTRSDEVSLPANFRGWMMQPYQRIVPPDSVSLLPEDIPDHGSMVLDDGVAFIDPERPSLVRISSINGRSEIGLEAILTYAQVRSNSMDWFHGTLSPMPHGADRVFKLMRGNKPDSYYIYDYARAILIYDESGTAMVLKERTLQELEELQVVGTLKVPEIGVAPYDGGVILVFRDAMGSKEKYGKGYVLTVHADLDTHQWDYGLVGCFDRCPYSIQCCILGGDLIIRDRANRTWYIVGLDSEHGLR